MKHSSSSALYVFSKSVHKLIVNNFTQAIGKVLKYYVLV